MQDNISIGTFGLVHNKQMFIISEFIISDPDCMSVYHLQVRSMSLNKQNITGVRLCTVEIAQWPEMAFGWNINLRKDRAINVLFTYM